MLAEKATEYYYINKGINELIKKFKVKVQE